jgi:hypothetical protein
MKTHAAIGADILAGIGERGATAFDHRPARGRRDRCAAWSENFGYMARHCRFLDPVRGRPRVEAVLEQARVGTEAFRDAAGLGARGSDLRRPPPRTSGIMSTSNGIE